MRVLKQTNTFNAWIKGLRDKRAVARINTRLLRLSNDNFGDFRSVGDGVHELKFMFGPGYRVYYAIIGAQIILLIAGGDKSTQVDDILKAKQIFRYWKDEQDG